MTARYTAPNNIMPQEPSQYPQAFTHPDSSRGGPQYTMSFSSTYQSHEASEYIPPSGSTYESHTISDSRGDDMRLPYHSNELHQGTGMIYGHQLQFNPARDLHPPPPQGHTFQPASRPPPPPGLLIEKYQGSGRVVQLANQRPPRIQGSTRNHPELGHELPPRPRGFPYQQGFGHITPQSPQGFENGQGYGQPVPYPPYPTQHQPAVGNTPHGFMPATRTFQTRNEYQESSSGSFSRSNRHRSHTPQSMHSYAPLPYDSGPMEDFSSKPTIPAEEVHRQLVERASSEPRSDASAFRPMKRILLNQGIEIDELQGPPQPLGKAAGPKVPEHVNTVIYMEGLHPETTYRDLFRALRGKILRTHIASPNKKFPTAAAKVGFFKRIDALKTMHAVKTGQMYIRGLQVPIVKWNWDGATEEQIIHNAHLHSRVIHIKGPSNVMNMEFFDNLFKSKIYFDLEDKFEVPCNEEGMTRYEWRFGSIPNQAEAAVWIIEREPNLKESGIEVSYGPDPCEMG